MRSTFAHLLVLVAALLAVQPRAGAQTKPMTAEVKAITVEARPIASFEKSGALGSRYGALEWRGGLVLTSTAEGFGGWSGLVLDETGRMLAVSDAGAWMMATLEHSGKAPTKLSRVTIGPIRARDGKTLAKNRDRDAESVALLSGTLDRGTLLIGFERNDRIGRFDTAKGNLSAPATYLKMPPEARRLKNEGFEAVTVVAGGAHKGAIVAIAEDPLRGETEHTGWMWIAGEPKRFTLAGVGDFGVTDAASLSDGTLLVLERRFRWFDGVRIRIRRIAAGDLRPGAVVKGEVLLAADLSHEIDNMEGLAVREEASGAVVLTLISDDNFNKLLQRTVLLEFALPAKKKPPLSATRQGGTPSADAKSGDAAAAEAAAE